MAMQNATQIGHVIDGYLITQSLSKNRFSEVFLALSVSDGSKAIYKVPNNEEEQEESQKSLGTEALMMVTGGVRGVSIDAAELLEHQFNILENFPLNSNIVKAQKFQSPENGCFMRTEFIEGNILKDILLEDLDLSQRRRLLKTVLAAAAQLLASGQKHGDLTPGNIIIDGQTVRFIDPGYFGSMRTEFGRDSVTITTPAYYPHLVCDDLYALGIIAWEIMTRIHPLRQSPKSIDSIPHEFSDSIIGMIKTQQLTGIHYLEPLLQLKLPAEINREFSASDITLLMKGLRLRTTESGRIETDEGFDGAEEMAQAWFR